jgi:hypothetical protein
MQAQLSGTPSRLGGWTPEQEQTVISAAVALMDSMVHAISNRVKHGTGKQIDLNTVQRILFTAAVLFHRFFLVNSFSEKDSRVRQMLKR